VHLDDAVGDELVPAKGILLDAAGPPFRKVPFQSPTGMRPLSLRSVLAISNSLSAAFAGST
jgi:hypothetical protein